MTETDFEQRYSSESRSFQASFSDYASSIGVGASRAGLSGFTSEDYRKVCHTRARDFAEFVSSTEEASSGAYLAKEFVSCIQVISDAEIPILTGLVRQIGEPNRFVASFRYEPVAVRASSGWCA